MNTFFQKIILLLLIIPNLVFAQDRNDAFIYIQGDKETPFYVKVEGQMQDRMSKNYFIINQLDGGPTKLSILFEKNKYPEQKYIINVPQSGERSFMLKKTDNANYALYDLNQHFYLANGNALEDDAPITDPSQEVQNLAQKSTTPATDTKEQELPNIEKRSKSKKNSKSENDDIPEFTIAKATETPTASSAENKENRFMNFEIGEAQNTSKRREKRVAEEKEPEVTAQSNIETGNCPEALDDDAFNMLAQKLTDRTDEEVRLNYLRKYGTKKCYNTEQVRILALSFDSQSARYEVAKMLVPRTIDPENYKEILKVFNTNFIKNKFIKEVIGE